MSTGAKTHKLYEAAFPSPKPERERWVKYTVYISVTDEALAFLVMTLWYTETVKKVI